MNNQNPDEIRGKLHEKAFGTPLKGKAFGTSTPKVQVPQTPIIPEVTNDQWNDCGFTPSDKPATTIPEISDDKWEQAMLAPSKPVVKPVVIPDLPDGAWEAANTPVMLDPKPNFPTSSAVTSQVGAPLPVPDLKPILNSVALPVPPSQAADDVPCTEFIIPSSAVKTPASVPLKVEIGVGETATIDAIFGDGVSTGDDDTFTEPNFDILDQTIKVKINSLETVRENMDAIVSFTATILDKLLKLWIDIDTKKLTTSPETKYINAYGSSKRVKMLNEIVFQGLRGQEEYAFTTTTNFIIKSETEPNKDFKLVIFTEYSINFEDFDDSFIDAGKLRIDDADSIEKMFVNDASLSKLIMDSRQDFINNIAIELESLH